MNQQFLSRDLEKFAQTSPPTSRLGSPLFFFGEACVRFADAC
jgi:hypothetical protein